MYVYTVRVPMTSSNLPTVTVPNHNEDCQTALSLYCRVYRSLNDMNDPHPNDSNRQLGDLGKGIKGSLYLVYQGNPPLDLIYA